MEGNKVRWDTKRYWGGRKLVGGTERYEGRWVVNERSDMAWKDYGGGA